MNNSVLTSNRHSVIWLKNVAVFLVYAFVPFILFFTITNQGNLIVAGDGVGFFAMREFLNNAISGGEFPLWSPYIQNGTPVAMDQSWGAFYPITYMLSFLPINWFVLVYYSVHVGISGFFMYLFMQEEKVDAKIAFVVGLLISMGIFMGGARKSHMMIISVIAWIPAVFYYVKKYVNSSNTKNLFYASIIMSLQFLAGFAQSALYIDIIVGIYLLSNMIHKKMKITHILKDGLTWGLSYIGLIAVQLIPLLSLMLFYQSEGAAATTFDTFGSYSISFRKLIMMIFPLVFGSDVHQSYSYAYSSGLDIELFIGAAILLLVLVGVLVMFRKFEVKLITILAIVCFIYAANAHVPFLSEILFQIPILSGFRVPSRILPIFLFFIFTLFGLSLQHFWETEKKTLYVKIAFSIVMLFIIIACLCYSLTDGGIISVTTTDFYELENVFLPSIVIAIIVVGGLYLTTKYNNRNAFTGFLVLITSLTIFQIYPYYIYSEITPMSQLSNTSEVEQLKSVVDSGMIWYGSQYDTAYYQSINGINKSNMNEIPTLNGYIAMNKPNMYKLLNNGKEAPANFSGLYTFFPNSRLNLSAQNDVISMLGVSVIADKEGNIPQNGSIFEMHEENQTVFSLPELTIPNQKGELFVYHSPIVEIEPKTYYKVKFDAGYLENTEYIYFDLFGTGYDFTEQDVQLRFNSDSGSYEYYIFSGEVPEDTEIVFRIVGMPNHEIPISDLFIIEMNTEEVENVYEEIYKENGYTYYKNNRVQDEVYFAESVSYYENLDTVYAKDFLIDFSKSSYIEGEGVTTHYAGADILRSERLLNSITTEVVCESDSFLVFSETYNPEWTAYINGEKAELHQVNGIIQGVFVPEGTHTVEFKFVPVSVYIGSTISMSVLLIGGSICLLKKSKYEDRV